MADETAQRLQDAEEHRKSYEQIMKFSAEVGVPASLGLTAFFTNLVMANGIGVAFVSFVATYLFVYFVVRAFFSH